MSPTAPNGQGSTTLTASQPREPALSTKRRLSRGQVRRWRRGSRVAKQAAAEVDHVRGCERPEARLGAPARRARTRVGGTWRAARPGSPGPRSHSDRDSRVPSRTRRRRTRAPAAEASHCGSPGSPRPRRPAGAVRLQDPKSECWNTSFAGIRPAAAKPVAAHVLANTTSEPGGEDRSGSTGRAARSIAPGTDRRDPLRRRRRQSVGDRRHRAA